MASFWGCEVTSGKPYTYEPDPVGELQLTSVALVAGKKCVLMIQADDGREYALCNLSAEKREQAKLDLLLGAGNEKVSFRAAGEKATLHLTGYLVVPEEIAMDDDEPPRQQPQEDEKTLARTMFGSARLADEEPADEEQEAAAKLYEDDFKLLDDDEGAARKKRKVEEPKTPEEDYKARLVAYLSKNGKSPLSKLGTECKKPAEVKSKLKAFLNSHPDTFKLEGADVSLAA